MKDPTRPTKPTVSLTNAHKTPPTPGQRVLALQHGGVLVPEVWTSSSINHFDAWMEYPDVPEDVKKLQSERFKRGN